MSWAWGGGVFSGLLSPPLPEPCAYNCDQRSFTLNLPDSAWAASDSGVLVSIHYPSWSDSLALYVFDPSGNLVGSSYGLDTNGQGVFLSHPTAGDYQVVVTETFAQDPAVTYVGEVRYQATRTLPCAKAVFGSPGSARSEEHTSELQSPDHLVCRLLL